MQRTDDKDRLRELMDTHEKHLHKLKQQQAVLGINAPPYVLLEIERIEKEIQKLKWRPDRLKDLMDLHEKHLHKLKLQQATFGILTPPYILLEIERIEKEIQELKQKLGDVDTWEQLTEIVSAVPLTEQEKAILQHAHWHRKKILVENELSGGFSGARVFRIQPISKDGYHLARVITKVGSVRKLSEEKDKYTQHVAASLPFCTARVDGANELYKLGDQTALNYMFVGGGALGDAVTLEEYYQRMFPKGLEQLNTTVDNLLDKDLGQSWYGQTKPLTCFFREEYGRHLVGHLDECGQHQVDHAQMRKDVSAVFPDLALDDDSGFVFLPCEPKPESRLPYPNPLLVYPDVLNTNLEGRLSRVHGDLHLRNVLVDESGKGWLIDFAKVGERHNLFDFVRLETRIRTWELLSEYSTEKLSDYLAFEAALSDTTLGLITSPPDDPHLRFACEVILRIRQIARKYMGPEPNFRKEYFPALFLYCLAVTKYYKNEGEHSARLAFGTACVLARYLLNQDEVAKMAAELHEWTQTLPQSELSQDLRQSLGKLTEHTGGAYQYLELALPIIPGILSYKVELGSQHLAKLDAIWERIQARLGKSPKA